MRFEELISFATTTKNGAGKTEKNHVPTIVTAQYPANRDQSSDSNNTTINPLYKNGLIFKAYNYTDRTTTGMISQRKEQQNLGMLGGITQSIAKNTKYGKKLAAGVAYANSFNKQQTASAKESKSAKEPICLILMPRSKSDNEVISHKFNDVGESRWAKGGGSITGMLSTMASSAVFGGIDSMTQGIMADNGEQIHTTARSMYNGADNRVKTFTWDLTPRTPQDLIAIMTIYQYFSYLSYGITGNSKFAKEIKAAIDNWYKNTFLAALTPADADRSNTLMEGITEFLSNVIVVTNPTVWFVENFGVQSSYDGVKKVFGPAQISNIRLDSSPDGEFHGLDIAPNLPSTFVLEITMREILTLSRQTLYGVEL